MFETIKKNLLRIQEDIAPCKPRIIAVTKYFSKEAMIAAYEAGLRDFGESRVIEASEKINSLPDEVRKNSTFHLIGHLQVNKVRQAVPMFDLIHSVDSRKLLDEIEKVAAKHDKVQDVLLQVNVAREASKTGMTVEEFPEIRDYAKTLPHVRIRGLMCMAPFFDDPEEARPIFRIANALYEDMKGYFEEGQIQYLSMGMTHDFEVALEEGANIVRVGTAIFGERVYY